MSQFEQSLNDVVEIVGHWASKIDVQEVTVLRDLWGKIRLVIDVGDKTKIPSRQIINQFQTNLSQRLGIYWGGAVWFIQREDKPFQAARRQIEAQRERWLPDGYQGKIRWFRLERRYSKLSWLQEGRRPVWSLRMGEIGQTNTAIVSFFSFKGGVGRSTALAAVAILLAQVGKSVFLLDLDLESPGISTFMLDEYEASEGLLDYLVDLQASGQQPDLRNYIATLSDVSLAKPIYVIRAGQMNVSYLEKLARLDFDSYLRDSTEFHPLEVLLRQIHQEYTPDFILLDVRAGFHDLGGLSINGLSHLDIVFARNDWQSRAGLEMLFDLLLKPSIERDVFLVHAQTPLPVNGLGHYDPDLHEEFRLFAFDLFGRFYSKFRSSDFQQPDINDADAPYGIPIPFVPELQRLRRWKDMLEIVKEERYGFIRLARLIGTYLQKETV